MRFSALAAFSLAGLAALAMPRAVLADDGVQAAVAAAKAAWPAARISAASTQASCPVATVVDTPSAARNGLSQVRVRCSANPGWTRYIALHISQQQAIAVLRAPLARGETLSAEAIDWQQRDVFTVSADVLTPASATALVAKRDLAAGSVLTASQFAAPKAIARGQSVTLVSRSEGMEVRAPGEALADAALGARVKVRNNTSRRIVEGVAQGNGTVEVAS